MLRFVVHVSASASEVSKDTLMAIARARKNVPVTPVIEISGKNTTMGVNVEPISGTVSSFRALLVACKRPLAPIAMQHDVLHDHDGIVNYQATSRGQPSQESSC